MAGKEPLLKDKYCIMISDGVNSMICSTNGVEATVELWNNAKDLFKREGLFARLVNYETKETTEVRYVQEG